MLALIRKVGDIWPFNGVEYQKATKNLRSNWLSLLEQRERNRCPKGRPAGQGGKEMMSNKGRLVKAAR